MSRTQSRSRIDSIRLPSAPGVGLISIMDMMRGFAYRVSCLDGTIKATIAPSPTLPNQVSAKIYTDSLKPLQLPICAKREALIHESDCSVWDDLLDTGQELDLLSSNSQGK
jgi:hypothetical protein